VSSRRRAFNRARLAAIACGPSQLLGTVESLMSTKTSVIVLRTACAGSAAPATAASGAPQ
jgi:hypothetical protein